MVGEEGPFDADAIGVADGLVNIELEALVEVLAIKPERKYNRDWQLAVHASNRKEIKQ